MAGGNLSPRQKMINMMYLVLTALLALNVSKEILKAFHLMEVSFENSKKNIDAKNDIAISAFQASMEKNAARTKPWFDKANEVRKIAKEFNDYVDKVRIDIGTKSRKPAEEGEEKGALTELAEPDNMEKHANYFAEGSGKQGKGKPLQVKINETRKAMIALLSAPASDPKKDEKEKNFKTLREQYEKQSALRADDPKEGGATKKTWVSVYLEHAPLAGVMALLAKIQNDCKNLESDILSELSKQIDASTFKVDKLVATVLPESPLVMTGQAYKADIVITAINTSSNPKMVVNGQPITVEGGMGKYSVQATTAGVNQVKGYIEVEGPDGIEKLDIASEWMAFAPAATISPSAMNVLYIGLENPIDISVPGFSPDAIVANITSGAGSLNKTKPGKYIAKVNRVQGSKATISVSVKLKDGTSKSMGSMEFKIRPVPKPEAKWGQLESGKAYSVGSIMAQAQILADMGAGWAFDGVNYKVTSFTLLYIPKRGEPKQVKGTGNSLASVKSGLSLKSGDKIIVTAITAQGPDGAKPLSPIILDVQ